MRATNVYGARQHSAIASASHRSALSPSKPLLPQPQMDEMGALEYVALADTAHPSTGKSIVSSRIHSKAHGPCAFSVIQSMRVIGECFDAIEA